MPRLIKDEFDAFLECGILANGFLRLRCGKCGHDKLLAFSCKRRGFRPPCGARRMSQTAAHLVTHVIPQVPVQQWVLSRPIPLRVLPALQAVLVKPVLRVQREVRRHLLDDAGLCADEGQGGAVILVQRFGSAADFDIHLHCLVLDGVYRCAADGAPAFVGAAAPIADELHALQQTVIARRLKMLTRRGVLVEDMGQNYLAKPDADTEEARSLRSLHTAAATCRIAFGRRAGQKVLTLRGAMPCEAPTRQPLCADIDGRAPSGSCRPPSTPLSQAAAPHASGATPTLRAEWRDATEWGSTLRLRLQIKARRAPGEAARRSEWAPQP